MTQMTASCGFVMEKRCIPNARHSLDAKLGIPQLARGY